MNAQTFTHAHMYLYTIPSHPILRLSIPTPKTKMTSKIPKTPNKVIHAVLCLPVDLRNPETSAMLWYVHLQTEK